MNLTRVKRIIIIIWLILFCGLFLFLTVDCNKGREDNSRDVGRYQFFESRDGRISGFLDTRDGYALTILVGPDSSVVRVIGIKQRIAEGVTSDTLKRLLEKVDSLTKSQK